MMRIIMMMSMISMVTSMIRMSMMMMSMMMMITTMIMMSMMSSMMSMMIKMILDDRGNNDSYDSDMMMMPFYLYVRFNSSCYHHLFIMLSSSIHHIVIIFSSLEKSPSRLASLLSSVSPHTDDVIE